MAEVAQPEVKVYHRVILQDDMSRTAQRGLEMGIQASLVNDIVKQVGSLLSFRDADPLRLRDALFILEDSTEAWIKTGLLGDIEACPYFLNQSFVRLHCPMTCRFHVKQLLHEHHLIYLVILLVSVGATRT